MKQTKWKAFCLIPSRVKPSTIKLLFTASLFDVLIVFCDRKMNVRLNTDLCKYKHLLCFVAGTTPGLIVLFTVVILVILVIVRVYVKME